MEIDQELLKKEIAKIKKKALEYKANAEANIVGALYRNTELMYTTDLELKDFNNPHWQLYFAIINELVIKEKKEHLDDITIGMFLEKHPKMKVKYDQYKGYDTITGLIEMTNDKNYESYLLELNKWKTALNLINQGIVVTIKDFVDSTLEELYDFYEAVVNDSFVKGAEEDISGVYDIADGLDELIVELDKGLSVGLPYDDMPLLTKETNGSSFGNLTMIGGLSGTGKSSFVRNKILPSIIKKNEQILVILNEEDEQKWRAEMLIWVANNIFKKEITKYDLLVGKFSAEHKKILVDSANWTKEHKDKIIIIPFKRWNTLTAIKIIKKHQRAFGFKYFVIDTFKPSTNSDSSNIWLDMMIQMIMLYDTIKKGKNSEGVSLTCTFQLAKESANKRHYSQSSMGISRNMIDVASVCIMSRWLFPDEYPDEKHAIQVYEIKGKGTKIPIALNPNKRYQVFFLPKTRFGASDAYQIVAEVDLARNIIKEIGLTTVHQDY